MLKFTEEKKFTYKDGQACRIVEVSGTPPGIGPCRTSGASTTTSFQKQPTLAVLKPLPLGCLVI
jgi:hypothetical protein